MEINFPSYSSYLERILRQYKNVSDFVGTLSIMIINESTQQNALIPCIRIIPPPLSLSLSLTLVSAALSSPKISAGGSL